MDDGRNGRIDRHSVSDLQKPTIKQQRKTPNKEIKKLSKSVVIKGDSDTGDVAEVHTWWL